MERLKTLDLSGCYRVENLSENLQQAKFLEELDLSETAITEPPSFIFQFKNLKVLSFNGLKGSSCKLLPNFPFLFKVIQGRRTNPMARMLPLLSGLSSLRELQLRDCNLCEGDIPRDISGLSCLEKLDLSGNNFISIPASLTRLSKLEDLILSNCNMCTFGEADTHSDISGLSSLNYLDLSDNNFISIPASLTRLSNLSNLILSNCNIRTSGEADTHGDISGLSSLGYLDLTGKNFITLPLALTQLSRLKLLKLSGCKMLKSLPELPTRILIVIIDGCSSLEVVASPSKVVRNLVGGVSISATNCFKLAEKINALALLKEHIKAVQYPRGEFDTSHFFHIKMPGGEIPEWFSQQKSDSSIKIPLPINQLLKDSQCIGVACCCIFVNNDASRYNESIGCGVNIYCRNSEQASCNGSIFRGRNYELVNWSGWELGEPVMKDHLLLRYWSRNLWKTRCLDTKCDELEVSFRKSSVKVKKCGVRMVYEKDLEEMKELQCDTTQSSPNFEHIHQHSAQNHGSVGSTSHIKRKRNIYEEMEEEEP